MTFHIGVDVGGTFTDTISIDTASGRVGLSKVPSTTDNQAVGFLSGLRKVNAPLEEVSWLVHGTTVGTNATLERNGAVCGLITTRGFRDIIELGRRERPHLFGLFGTFEPLIARRNRLEVSERLDASGVVVVPLDEEEVRRAALQLKAQGCESLLIAFMHSYANPAHEIRAAEIAAEVWEAPFITTSAAILGEFRETERFGTAAVNAYIQPKIHRYVTRLKRDLREAGVPRDLLIMQANGGIMSADAACERSVATVLSGPAAGVIAAAYVSHTAGVKNVITCDTGGTSFDVGLIVDGQPVVTSDRDLDFRIPIRIPIIDIHTIGAGGGSIASVDAGGILQVGPESAGSTPGPIAYGRGGRLPTVTDANVLLGRLPSSHLLAVEGDVDIEHIRAAFAEIGAKLDIGAVEAATSVLKVVNDKMAGAMRLVSLQRGYDPREFAVFAFGGAGPLHGTELARELGVPQVIIPYVPGITCALGCIVADVRHDFVRTVNAAVDDTDIKQFISILAEQRAAGELRLQEDAVPVESISVMHEADMQYEGQVHSLRVKLDPDSLDIDSLKTQLRDTYIARFGIDLSGFRAKIINLRTTVIGIRPQLDLRRIVAAPEKGAGDIVVGARDVWFEGGWVSTPILRRERLPVGYTFEGPAIIEQMDTTSVITPGCSATVDEFGNLLVNVR